MPDWEELRKIAASEGEDLADGLRRARDHLDAHLAKKEAELAATPQERMDMLLEDIAEQQAATDALLAESDPEGGSEAASDVDADAEAEPAATPSGDDSASGSNTVSSNKTRARPVSELQVEYEQRKADADDLLDELRGELGISGDEPTES